MVTKNNIPCDCARYEPIELDRASITKRIKQSPRIRKRLTQIAENAELRLYLFRCSDCGQFWQSGHEWHFSDREYLFRVPAIEIEEWQREPYRQPAAMMLFSARMESYFAQNSFETGDAKCRAEGCSEAALKLSVFCRDHHIESLQARSLLPKKPIGRLFPPYYEGKPH